MADLRLSDEPSWDHAVGLVLAAGLILLYYHTRAFALRVQDRVIFACGCQWLAYVAGTCAVKRKRKAACHP